MVEMVFGALGGVLFELIAMLLAVLAAVGWSRARADRAEAERDAAEANDLLRRIRESKEIENEVEALNDGDLGDAARRWLRTPASDRR
jgi:uncharacterized membrane protein